ncbi:GntR family transcriptional regulator [Aurantimonas sp. 22II-16-19i]|uniref:GntR family transcriptional regulator n=1 Tax=Aurantimonas sp. 22II-16-19i TaxID=1317114 RepID=UPI0009F7B6B3|nr:GntR family transcriptional regulator [Aurantimonas sp. 22II-16-19i]ORE97611.1 GntR family transcriptional regulator [Aurantimonas sp. 22II-16-19i]
MKPKRDAVDRVAQICSALRRAIIERALSPGDKLPEDQLGESFGVSRTIARQALGQLAAEGLVNLRRNRIAVVATPTVEEARDTFEIRIALEALVADCLAAAITPEQIAELRRHIADQAAADPVSQSASIRLATDFHVLLAGMTGRPILERYVTEVAYRSGLALSAYGRPHSNDCAIEEHRQIVDALEEGDAEVAAAAMTGHLSAVADRAMIRSPERVQRDLAAILAPFIAG